MWAWLKRKDVNEGKREKAEDIGDGERGDEPGGSVGEAEPGSDTEMNPDPGRERDLREQTEC